MKCPTCTIDLIMSDKQGIEIDYCPKCRGVWLDRGELDKIIGRSVDMQARDVHEKRASGSEQKQYAQDVYHKKHRKKSFLEELFD
ncbi:MAG TPA: zf-TFIIB domain-containing protein [Dissulfurispiraceae bacterium]|nr:zf-TFIIB domain-containing protein [Dissulfurispiraceae bacterium]